MKIVSNTGNMKVLLKGFMGYLLKGFMGFYYSSLWYLTWIQITFMQAVIPQKVGGKKPVKLYLGPTSLRIHRDYFCFKSGVEAQLHGIISYSSHNEIHTQMKKYTNYISIWLPYGKTSSQEIFLIKLRMDPKVKKRKFLIYTILKHTS